MRIRVGLGHTLALIALLLAASAYAVAQTFVPPEPRGPAPSFRFPEHALSKLTRASMYVQRPVRNALGQYSYIVSLEDSAVSPFIGLPPPVDGLAEWHKPEMRNLAAALGRQYGFTTTDITSWIDRSLTAYLTVGQVARLSLDPRVRKISRNLWLRTSANLWYDATGPQNQTISWGTVAVGGSLFPFDQSVTVYVLDSGVGYHTDLGTVVDRRIANSNALFPVGCYSHATHVAGILSGYGSGLGTLLGVNPMVRIVSIAVNEAADPDHACSIGQPTTATTASGLDMIYQMLQGSQRAGIINISINGEQFVQTGVLGQKFPTLTTPTVGFPGALIVQSAGNEERDACLVSYDARQPADGVVVVGGHDANGQPVVRLNGVDGFRNGDRAGSEPGSNFGWCVDVWAPSNNIYSTWGGSPQRGDTTYSGHALLSGTSMAAPHITGLASYAQSAWGPVTPQSLESAIRSWSYWLGSRDSTTRVVNAATLGSAYPTALPTAEFLINGYVNGSINAFSDEKFSLKYEVVGAQSCTLTGYVNGAVWYTAPDFDTKYDWGLVGLTPGTYRWTVDCVSAQGTHNVAAANAVVSAAPPTPIANWYVNGVVATGQTISVPSTQQFELRYVSTDTSSCDLDAFRGPVDGWLERLVQRPGHRDVVRLGVDQPAPESLSLAARLPRSTGKRVCAS